MKMTGAVNNDVSRKVGKEGGNLSSCFRNATQVKRKRKPKQIVEPGANSVLKYFSVDNPNKCKT